MSYSKNGQTIKLHEDKGSKSPYVVSIQLFPGDWFRPVYATDDYADAYRVYNNYIK